MLNDDGDIISGFWNSQASESPFAIDFGTAKRLDRSGSTCDAYVCTVQRRRVFVKRLKPEFRNNPVYRAAFIKEYDLGISLSHPSLPHYTGMGDDYLVLDYIEGDTLADLIRRNDPRLRDRAFVRKLLSQLIDVVEYLHFRNVIHCDIKADNIIVSPHIDRPITLIDLDKAYSPWLNTTHGNSANYDCDGCADGVIDFRGIGLIASKLNQNKVARACQSDNMSTAAVRESLKTSTIRLWFPAIICLVLLGIVAILITLPKNDTEDNVKSNPISTNISDTIPTVTQEEITAKESQASVGNEMQKNAAMEQKENESLTDSDWLNQLVASKIAVLDSERERIYRLMSSDSLKTETANMEWLRYAAAARDIKYEIYEEAKARYPEIPQALVQLDLHNVDRWLKWTADDDSLYRALNRYRNEHANR